MGMLYTLSSDWDRGEGFPNGYCKVKLTTLVEGDPKAPFSIAATPKCKGVPLLSLDCSTLPLILTLYES